MIIVSQDKNEIINFDNVESIDIVVCLDGTGGIPYRIYFETSSQREELGKYSTEERAKEVLQRIVETYEGCNASAVSTGYGYVKNRVYEMPED